jgi:hypothetical protein
MLSKATLSSVIKTNDANFRRLVDDMQAPSGVLPFVGAGLSIPLKFPGWTGFIIAQARAARIEPLIRERLTVGQFEEAAEDLLKALGPRAFHDAIEDAFGDHRLSIAKICGPVTLLPRLASGPVITTNFDHVLETVFKNAGLPFQDVACGARVDTASKAMTHNRRVLLKIHGDVNDRTDRILTLTDYRKHYGQKQISRPLGHLLKQILSSRPVLFLGCSLNCDRTVAILAHVAKVPTLANHYAIVERPPSREFGARARFLSKHEIRPIWYPAGRHDLIEGLLQCLLDQIPRPPGTESSGQPHGATGTTSPATDNGAASPASVGDIAAEKIVYRPVTRKLPDECRSVSHRFSIGGHEGHVTVVMYDDGQPGEILIHVSKEGSTISGLWDSFAAAISMALQNGVQLRALVDKFAHTRFEPSGWTGNPQVPYAKSLVDYIFRWLDYKFLGARQDA